MSKSLPNRRDLFRLAGIGASVVACHSAASKPLGIPVGIQPYTVRNELEKDFSATLHQLAAMGYQAVETGEPFYGQTPDAVRRALQSSGMVSRSGFYPYSDDDSAWAKTVDAAASAGMEYVVTTAPPAWTKSLDGWKRAAERFNRLGEVCRKAGIKVAYHNHNFEFRVFDGRVAYDEFLRLTDPAFVALEMDCFWVTFAGKDPVEYLQRYPNRFTLLHIKDLKPGQGSSLDWPKGNPFTEVGSGIIDYPRIFEAARTRGLKHYYVEQDRCDRPPLESARLSCEYLKKLVA